MSCNKPLLGQRWSWALLLALALLAGCGTNGTSQPEPGEAAGVQSEQAALEARFAQAVALKQAGEIGPAESEFLDLSRSHPQFTGPLANLGIIARERGNTAQAQDYFEQVVALDSTHPQARNELGILARQRGQFDQAEAHYRQALQGDPAYGPAMINLAILLELYRGRLDEALALVEHYKTLQTEPEPGLEDWLFDLKNRMN